MKTGKGQPTILLAEDEQGLRCMLATILQEAGFRTLIADNGSRALRLANEYYGKIDMLVSDIEMPGLTGPALAKSLRTLRPDLRVLLMSGGMPDAGRVNGEWVFLQKPFPLGKFLEEVRAAFPETAKAMRGGVV